MTRSIVCICAALLMTIAIVKDSDAALLKIKFKGEITSVIAGPLSVGETVYGSLIYDSNAPLSNFSPNNTNFNGAISDFDIAGRKIELPSFNILALAKFFTPEISIVRFGVAGWQGELYENLDLDFHGSDFLTSIFSIPTEFDLNELSSATFGYTLQKIGINDGFIAERFVGTITSLTVRDVSEPSTYYVFLSGLLVLAAWSQRRRHRLG